MQRWLRNQESLTRALYQKGIQIHHGRWLYRKSTVYVTETTRLKLNESLKYSLVSPAAYFRYSTLYIQRFPSTSSLCAQRRSLYRKTYTHFIMCFGSRPKTATDPARPRPAKNPMEGFWRCCKCQITNHPNNSLLYCGSCGHMKDKHCNVNM